MAFNSFQYATFLALVIFGYWSLPRTGRKLLILGASYFFYAWVDIRFTAILLGTTLIDFTVARAMGRSTDDRARRLLLTVSVGSNLLTLAFFKYFDWFRAPVERVLETLGFTDARVALVVVLPIGISFYTFSTLSYTIDVYRREIEPTKSLIDFMVFISYFPHLLAGPIIRAKRMMPQIQDLPKSPKTQQMREGLELIFIGLFQKVAIADALSPATAQVFSQFGDGTGSSGPGWVNLWVATLAAVIQFTLDFAGYSNIARGSSKLLGIELPYNFRQPLTRSRNFRDFWRRDHMTLMAWFRDYLYRPLRGKGHGALWNSAALCIVFALSGLWHDDGLVWLTWGFVMGGVLSIELWVAQRADARRRAARKRARAKVRAEREAGDEGPGTLVPGGEVEGALAVPTMDLGGPAGTAAGIDHGQVSAGVIRRRDRAAEQAAADRVSRLPAWWPIVAPVYVFIMVAVQHAWVRTGSVGASLRLYGQLLWPRFAPIDQNLMILFAYALGALILLDRREAEIERRDGKTDPMTLGRALGYGAMVVLIVIYSGQAPVPFVYFQI
ncbi:MAG: MBOAT family O-acyltransferase [Iamia sp.]